MNSGQLLNSIFNALKEQLPAGVMSISDDGSFDDNSIVFDCADGTQFILESSSITQLSNEEEKPYYHGYPVDPGNPERGTYVREVEPGRWLVYRPGKKISYTVLAPPPRHHITSPPDSTIDRCFPDAIDTSGRPPTVIPVT